MRNALLNRQYNRPCIYCQAPKFICPCIYPRTVIYSGPHRPINRTMRLYGSPHCRPPGPAIGSDQRRMTPSRAAGAAPPDQRPRAGAAPPHQPRPPGTGHRQTADHHQRNEGTGATPERPKGPGRGRHRSPPGAERPGREAEHKPEGRQHSTFFVTLRKGPFPPPPGLNQIHRDSTQTIRP